MTTGRRVGSFAAIGAANLALEVALFNAVHLAGVGPVPAKVLANLTACASSYYLNRRFTFPDSSGRVCPAQLASFGAVNGMGLLVQVACVLAVKPLLHTTGLLALNLAGNVVGVALALGLRYWLYRLWVFGRPDPAPAVLSAVAA